MIRFGDDATLFKEKTKQPEKKKLLSSLMTESLKVSLLIHKGKTKYVTNYADREYILIDQDEKRKKSDKTQIPWTNHIRQRYYKRRYLCQDQSNVELFGGKKTRKYSKIDKSPISLNNNNQQKTKQKTKKKKRKKVMDQCVLPTMIYGCQTWSLNKHLTKQTENCSKKMERKMLNLKL